MSSDAMELLDDPEEMLGAEISDFFYRGVAGW